MDEKNVQELAKRVKELFKEFGVEGKSVIEIESAKPLPAATTGKKRCVRYGIDARTGKKICLKWE